MWGFASNAITSIGLKRSSSEPSRVCLDSSDDEVCSNSSQEEGLECPICLESFNIVENVPHVLWCGHTLCRNCVLGLQWALFKFSSQKFKIPFFIACPWCHLLSLRLVYKGNLKFPRKNFFLLWMIESFNGERVKFGSALSGENQQIGSPRASLAIGNQTGNGNLRRTHSSCPSLSRYNHDDRGSNVEWHHFSLQKSLESFIHITSKFPLVIVFLLIVFFAIPGCAIILALYLLLTVVFAIPSFFLLYFAYPILERLVREITSWPGIIGLSPFLEPYGSNYPLPVVIQFFFHQSGAHYANLSLRHPENSRITWYAWQWKFQEYMRHVSWVICKFWRLSLNDCH